MSLLKGRNVFILSVTVTAILLETVVFQIPVGSPTAENVSNKAIIQNLISEDNAVLHHQNLAALSIGGQHYQLIPQSLLDERVAYAESTGTLKKFTLVASSDHGNMILPTGTQINLMTFNGSSPGPTIRVTQGDVAQVTVINKDDEIHSIDFHGSQLSAVPNFTTIPAGGSKTLTFVAINPGVWAYHCEANNVFELWEHPLKGMEGMFIVDPLGGYHLLRTNVIDLTNTGQQTSFHEENFRGPAREFTLDYSEYYLADAKTPHSDTVRTPEHDFDQGKMFNEIPTFTKVNGIPYGYLGPLLTLPPWNTATLADVITSGNILPGDPNPSLSALTKADSNGHTAATQLNVRQGDHVRFFVLNTGDKLVPFHIVGEQLDRVTVGSSMIAQRVQTFGIAPYSDATIDVVFEQPGVYAIVNHDYSMLFKGQGSIVVVWPSNSNMLPNPSNAVPPVSALPGTSIIQSICLYGIGPNQQYDGNTGDDNQFESQCSIGLPS